ncbi:MAG: PAS domain S-box protein [Chloroflexi bacterium]|nr:PAS domain S-box protein [Chloroflexota bacterium]
MQRSNPNRLIQMWQWLTQPSPAIADLAARRQAQLLAALLVFMVPMGILMTASYVIVSDHTAIWHYSDIYLTAAFSIIQLVAYGLSRTRYHHYAAKLAVVSTSAIIFGLIIPVQTPEDAIPLVYLVIPTIMSSLLLPQRDMYLLGGLHLAGMLVFQTIYPALTFESNWLEYNIAITGLLLLTRQHLARLEASRRAELAASEEKYRQLVEHSPLTIGLELDRKVVYINPAGISLLGAAHPAQVTGRSLFDFTAPDSRQLGQSLLERAQRAGEPTPAYELHGMRLDGSTMDLEVIAIPFLYNDGPATHIIARDITERKQAETALRRRESEMRALLDAIPDLMLQITRNGVLTAYHPSDFEPALPPDDVLGRSIYALQPDIAGQVMYHVHEALSTGQVTTFTYQLDVHDQPHHFEARVVASGEEECVIIVRDITEQVRAEAALRQSEHRFATAFRTSPDALAITRVRDEQYLEINEGFTTLTGYSPAEVLGRTVYDLDLLACPTDREWILREVDRHGAVWDAEIDFQIKNGQIKTGLLSARLINLNGEPCLLSITRDITERKATEIALQNSEARSQAILSAIPDLMFRISRTGVYLDAYAGDDTGLMIGQAEALSGTHMNQWLPPDTVAQFQEHILCTLLTQTMQVFEYQLAVPLGKRDFEGRMVVSGADEVLMIVRDITERKRTEAAEREQRLLAEALRDTAILLNRTLDPDEVMERILTHIGAVVPHDAANIMLFEDGIARVVRSQGYDQRGTRNWMHNMRLPLAGFPPDVRAALERGDPHTVNDTHADISRQDQPEVQWIRAYICAPITVEDRLLGMINLDSATPHAFSDDDAGRLLAFADQAGIAIRNARLYVAEREQRALSEALRDTAAAVTSTLDQNEVMERILTNIGHIIPHTAANIMLIGDDGVGRLVRGRRYEEYGLESGLEHRPIDLGNDVLLAQILDADPGYVVDDMRTAPHWIADPRREWIRSLVSSPMRFEGEVFGLITLESNQPGAFNYQDAERLQGFANQAAIAIHNARLYDELEQRVAARTTDLSVRNAVAETLSTSLDTGEMLNGVIHTTVQQLGMLGGAIYLLNPDSTAMQLATATGVPEDVLNLVSGILPGQSDVGQYGAASADDIPALLHQTGISAVLTVPIWQQQQIQGVITLVHDEPRPWRTEEARLLDVIGRQIGVALTNAALYAEAIRDEAHIRTILQSVADGLLVFDQDAHLTLMNPAAQALFAFYSAGPEAAAGRLWAWLQALDDPLPDTVEFALPTDALVKAGGQDIHTLCQSENCPLAQRKQPAWPCWLKPGHRNDDITTQCQVFGRVPRRAIQARCAAVYDPDAGRLGTVIALHDVTYYHELDELKGRFVSTVSHELRTPLSTVLLQISTLNKYYDRFVDIDRREMIGEIYQQANILREMVEDILELSRFDARRATPHKRVFDLAELCQEAVAAITPLIHNKQLDVDLVGLDDPVLVEGDRQQLMRALSNLVTNAAKYTPDDGTIALHLAHDTQAVYLEVRDTGIGIPVEEQLYVFDRFFRSQQATTMAGGTGLGLSITKEIVDLHDGAIELESYPGQGSTFRVMLPLHGGTHERPGHSNGPDHTAIA